MGRPLDGLRVIDFSHMVAGPYCSLQLAYFGAEVIKVESRGRPDPWRVRDGNEDIEQSGPFADHNKNKRSITLNLKSAKAVGLAKRLVAVSDVVIENFSADVMAKLGLDYPDLRAVKPDIIMLSLQGLGRTGPHAGHVSWGPTLLALSGMTYLWGLPEDAEPVGSQSSYPDFAVGAYSSALILAALFHRAATGLGQHLDVSQAEVTAWLLGPAYTEALGGGRPPRPRGNGSSSAAPWGCYRCAGEDAWCAVAVETEEHWRGLVAALADIEPLRRAEFETAPGRLAHARELDRLLEGWTRKRAPEEVARHLQAHGVPASAVATGRTLVEDAHLGARGFLVELTHPRMGTFLAPGIPVRLSDTPGTIHRHAPLLGQDNDYVFGELLGLEPAAIAALEREGVIA